MSTVAENQVATGTKVVQARNVSKIFRREAFEVKALDDVSIDIAAGRIHGIDGTVRVRQDHAAEHDCSD